MEQASLDFTRTHARRSDPITSKAAARSVFESSRAQREVIYMSLLRHGSPLTADEIAQREGMSIEQCCRRLPELADVEKDGRVERLAETRLTRSGRPAHLWRLRQVQSAAAQE